MQYRVAGFTLLLPLTGSLLFPASHIAYAHTFSTSESAQFLSIVDQIRAETALVATNLENNNLTLAQAHAEKASSLLNNSTINDSTTLNEIRERNIRIADGLETGLVHLEPNITALAVTPQGEQIPQDRIQNMNQKVVSLNDLLAEAVTVRVESEHHNNATTWAMVLADLTNVLLGNYGNATGAPFDLTNMSNLQRMEGGIELDHTNNNMTMTEMNSDHLQISSDSGGNNNTIAMMSNATSQMSNMTTTTIVDAIAYQSAQHLANSTLLQLFYDTLKPITISATERSTDNNNATSVTRQLQNNNLTSDNNNNISNIDELEAELLQLKNNINDKVTPHEVMTTVHLGIHPLLIQLYGLTIEEQEREGDHLEHTGSSH